MNTARQLRMLLLGLPLMAVPMGAWSQDAPQLSEKVQKLAERDPAGGIMTLTAVLVVFLALLMLVFIFQFIGNLFQKRSAPKAIQPTVVKTAAPSVSGKPSDEALVAISLALRAELETQHDHESYVLTIRRRPTQWNARIQETRTRAYKH